MDNPVDWTDFLANNRWSLALPRNNNEAFDKHSMPPNFSNIGFVLDINTKTTLLPDQNVTSSQELTLSSNLGDVFKTSNDLCNGYPRIVKGDTVNSVETGNDFAKSCVKDDLDESATVSNINILSENVSARTEERPKPADAAQLASEARQPTTTTFIASSGNVAGIPNLDRDASQSLPPTFFTSFDKNQSLEKIGETQRNLLPIPSSSNNGENGDRLTTETFQPNKSPVENVKDDTSKLVTESGPGLKEKERENLHYEEQNNAQVKPQQQHSARFPRRHAEVIYRKQGPTSGMTNLSWCGSGEAMKKNINVALSVTGGDLYPVLSPRDCQTETRITSSASRQSSTSDGSDTRKSVHLKLDSHLMKQSRPVYSSSFRRLSIVSPLARFQRAVKTVCMLLRATKSESECKTALISEDYGTARRAYDMYGLTFDPSIFKATREVPLSNDARVILTMEPAQRTAAQLKVAVNALARSVEAFNEFPVKMQRSLVQVGWYEHFEAKRIIIQQGHAANNFYLILSGSALVSVLQLDEKTKEYRPKTVNVMSKGNSFGEIALISGAKRTATVSCKTDVSLLAVTREDFIEIFMHVGKHNEPEHIRFLRTVDVLKGWPLEMLPMNDPKVCIYTFFRRGSVLRKGQCNKWLYIVRSGTCHVLKDIKSTKPTLQGSQRESCGTWDDVTKLPPISKSGPQISTRKTGLVKKRLHGSFSVAENKKRTKGIFRSLTETSLRCDTNILFPTVPEEEQRVQKSSEQDRESLAYVPDEPKPVFVEMQRLGPKEIFGLEEIVFGDAEAASDCNLISEGAECILISKIFFKKHLSAEKLACLRKEIPPFPKEETLQDRLQRKTNWNAYKSRVISDLIKYKKLIRENQRLHIQ